jgi:hypothetical protein
MPLVPLVVSYPSSALVPAIQLWLIQYFQSAELLLQEHIQITEEGRRLVITRQLLQRLAQRDPNIAKTLQQHEKA